MKRLHSALATLVILAAAASSAIAHEFWIMPSSFAPDTNSLLRVRLHHGERFAGAVVPRNTPYIERFEFVTAEGATPVRGLHGQADSLLRTGAFAPGVLVYQSAEFSNNLPGPQFEAYLAEEGLAAISFYRREHGQTETEGREAYIRCAKSLLTVGGGDPEDRVVGLPLEIVLESAEGDEITAHVLFHGSPIEGLRVVAVSQAAPDQLIDLETDENGRVRFKPVGRGPWMLTSLHMVHETSREDIDWKSYWASLTFQPSPDTAAN